MPAPTFTPDEIDALFQERNVHPNPRVRKRMEALYLKACGLGTLQICKLVRITRSTLMLWIRLWEKGRMKTLALFDFKGGRRCALTPFKEQIALEFAKTPPKTLDEACESIHRITGVRRARSSVRQFLIKESINV